MTCTFDLQNYPFDNQECFLVFVNKGRNKKIVQLNPPPIVHYNGGPNFLNYIIEQPEILDTSGPSCIAEGFCNNTSKGNKV